MKNFKLDPLTNDIIIENNQIQMIEENALLSQTCRLVLGTNTGEWFNNTEEGINFQNLWSKPVNYDLIEDEIKGGLIQVDETFQIESLEHELNDRYLKINFKARNEQGDEITTAVAYE